MKVGSGESTCFWGDRWLVDGPLKTQFPAVYAITSSKGGTVAQVRTTVDGEVWWDLGINRRVQDHMVREISSLLNLLDGFVPEDGNESDYRVWLGNKSNGTFTVKSCYLWLISDCPSPERFIHPKKIWSKHWPTIVSFFMWVAGLEKISTQDMMCRRGWYKEWVNHCYMCVRDGESAKHLLIHCDLAWRIWGLFLMDWNIKWATPPDITSLISSWPVRSNSKRKVLVLKVLPAAILWNFWKEGKESQGLPRYQ
ncbi:uncharacterized protein LOC113316701 [Papaver somniferum]|uniref:uncharacterized protein LOC113316701 n=1 Tax=Papaver somniferum TaxID=3469 RepID=UPI000E6FD3EF|nr:uncharacterized protein LOC113316701 [Papaver somniferum]